MILIQSRFHYCSLHYSRIQFHSIIPSNYNKVTHKQFSTHDNVHHPFQPTTRMLDLRYNQPNGYQSLYNQFQWKLPQYYNIGYDITDKHVKNGNGNHIAVQYETLSNKLIECTFNELSTRSNKLSNILHNRFHIQQRDRIGILSSQCIDTVIIHAATYKINAIAVPLFVLFGSDALCYRINDSGINTLFVETNKFDEIIALKQDNKLPNLKYIVVCDIDNNSTKPYNDPAMNIYNINTLIESSNKQHICVHSNINDPAVIIYTSGTTGSPKGALHAHRVLLGHLPGVEYPQNYFPQPHDKFWTPADWAWIGGLFDCVLTSLHHGIPVVAKRFRKFQPDLAFELIQKYSIKNMFMPPTALKLMRNISINDIQSKYMTNVRSIGCGGEPLGESLLEWARHAFNGITINEFYGQTECNLVLGNCSHSNVIIPGSMGLPIPGHIVHIVDDNGQRVSDGTVGNIGILQPDPVTFLHYWNLPQKTADKFVNNYLITGDMGKQINGYFYFFGRNDDVIKSGGYRIGPNEIEECLMKNQYVSNCAVVGEPDPTRGEIVKAFIIINQHEFIQLQNNNTQCSTDELYDIVKSNISDWVKSRLAAYEYPRKIIFVDSLPMTTTGKIIRNQLKLMK